MFEINGLEAPACKVAMPKKKAEVVLADVGSLLNWTITKQLLPYRNNRGDGRVSPITSEKVKAGVKRDVIGECTIGIWETEQGPKMCLNNFHSRLDGMLRRYAAGELTNEELNIPVSVRVQTDFLQSYMDMNTPGTAHRTKDAIKNEDLTFGGALKSVFSSLSDGCLKAIGENKWTVLSSILYRLADKESNNWFWPDVYQDRMLARYMANAPAGALQITQADQKRLTQAFQFWYDLLMSLESEKGHTNVNTVTRSAGFFGYVVCDRLGDARISKNHKLTAKRILKHIQEIDKLCSELTRGQKVDKMFAVKQFDKRLKKKTEE